MRGNILFPPSPSFFANLSCVCREDVLFDPLTSVRKIETKSVTRFGVGVNVVCIMKLPLEEKMVYFQDVLRLLTRCFISQKVVFSFQNILNIFKKFEDVLTI
jgi:hypothetical protein